MRFRSALPTSNRARPGREMAPVYARPGAAAGPTAAWTSGVFKTAADVEMTAPAAAAARAAAARALEPRRCGACGEHAWKTMTLCNFPAGKQSPHQHLPPRFALPTREAPVALALLFVALAACEGDRASLLRSVPLTHIKQARRRVPDEHTRSAAARKFRTALGASAPSCVRLDPRTRLIAKLV